MRKLVLFAAAPFLVAASPDLKQQALASAAPSIDKANSEWEKAIVTGDADVLAAPYDANGVFIGPDGSTVRGREAVHGRCRSCRRISGAPPTGTGESAGVSTSAK